MVAKVANLRKQHSGGFALQLKLCQQRWRDTAAVTINMIWKIKCPRRFRLSSVSLFILLLWRGSILAVFPNLLSDLFTSVIDGCVHDLASLWSCCATSQGKAQEQGGFLGAAAVFFLLAAVAFPFDLFTSVLTGEPTATAAGGNQKTVSKLKPDLNCATFTSPASFALSISTQDEVHGVLINSRHKPPARKTCSNGQ
ncbi:MAG: hypothetical protein FRX49_05040 [Trebouxia sp. A1-2]|nr:MAG: hypothetical protein FRX49_05040 [Trebouxia sp. A1-2]